MLKNVNTLRHREMFSSGEMSDGLTWIVLNKQCDILPFAVLQISSVFCFVLFFFNLFCIFPPMLSKRLNQLYHICILSSSSPFWISGVTHFPNLQICLCLLKWIKIEWTCENAANAVPVSPPFSFQHSWVCEIWSRRLVNFKHL